MSDQVYTLAFRPMFNMRTFLSCLLVLYCIVLSCLQCLYTLGVRLGTPKTGTQQQERSSRTPQMLLDYPERIHCPRGTGDSGVCTKKARLEYCGGTWVGGSDLFWRSGVRVAYFSKVASSSVTVATLAVEAHNTVPFTRSIGCATSFPINDSSAVITVPDWNGRKL